VWKTLEGRHQILCGNGHIEYQRKTRSVFLAKAFQEVTARVRRLRAWNVDVGFGQRNRRALEGEVKTTVTREKNRTKLRGRIGGEGILGKDARCGSWGGRSAINYSNSQQGVGRPSGKIKPIKIQQNLN